MKKTVDITMSLDILQARLVKALVKGGEPHAELVVKQILTNLELTEMGLAQLVYAFMGVEDELKWIAGDECMVSMEKFTRWQFEKAETEEAGLVYKGHMKGVVHSIDMRKKLSVEFKFTGIYSSGSEAKEIKIWVRPEDLKRELDMVLARPTIASMV